MSNYQSPGLIRLPQPEPAQRLAPLYREAGLSAGQRALLRKYLRAMAVLYGVLPLSEARAIVVQQAPEVTGEQFDAFCAIALREEQPYCLVAAEQLFRHPPAGQDGALYLLSRELLTGDRLPQLLRAQQGTSRHVPERAPLLRWQDESYSEPTPQKRVLQRRLKELLPTAEDAAAALELAAVTVRRLPLDLGPLLRDLSQRAFLSKEEQRELIALLLDFYNNARIPAHCGHTPLEAGRTVVLDQKGDGAFLQLRSGKVGRNDPCPCGSGKKYKRCCGA